MYQRILKSQSRFLSNGRRTRWEYTDGNTFYNEIRQYRHYGGYGIGWATLAMINGTLAGNDGGSAIGTASLSLFLGPIVTGYLAITAGSGFRRLERELILTRR
ncbi:hypothetical protein HDV02_003667 [Globomyces sp. JEL0801]|nr:hypothetical protein HDV02_003667 [Globomyces sp. JEL0801]